MPSGLAGNSVTGVEDFDAPWPFRVGSWSHSTDDSLTLVSYVVGPNRSAYVEPTAVGKRLFDMPLFLSSTLYVNVPLEVTYAEAFRGMPSR